jgi:penicillin-binding protein 2
MFGFLRIGSNQKKVNLDRHEDIEPHEIFYDHLAKKHEEQLEMGEKKFEISLPQKALRLPLALAGLFFLVVTGRIIELLTVEGKDFARQAEQNKYLFHEVQSDRGIIYDSSFNPLVQNLSTFDLQCDSTRMPAGDQKKRIINGLAAIINGNANDIESSIKSNKIPTVGNLDHQALIVLEARIADFPGCAVQPRPIRNYAQGSGLAQLLGYMGKIDPDELKSVSDVYSVNDYIGQSGLEKSYENVLRKNPGKLRIERDAKGNIISQQVSVTPESGSSVQLWLDLGLQKKLHDSMAAQLAKLGLQKGSAVAIDPKTGGILAMVSFPDFDNNAFSNSDSKAIQSLLADKNQPLFNRVISGRYLTGSTIKPFEASGALQEKLINPDKKIDCPGQIVVQNKYHPELSQIFHDNHTHGLTDMRAAIAESCNVYFWTIGGGYGNQQGLGPTRIKKYLDLFGWESPTNIDLPGEVSGFVPDAAWKKQQFAGTQDQSWNDGDTYNLAIGQGFIGITPLEVADAYAAIANGGTLYQPQMVKAVVDNNKKTVEQKQPVVIRQNFIDPQNLEIVREGMREGVNGAGAPLASSLILNSLPVPVAAKTGTAQLRKDASGKDIMNSWANVFGPYDDPQIVLVVMMGDVHEGQFAVLPVAKDVLGWYFEPKNANGIRISDETAIATSTDSTLTAVPADIPTATTTAPQQ